MIRPSSQPFHIVISIESYTQVRISETFVEQIQEEENDCHVIFMSCSSDEKLLGRLDKVASDLGIEFKSLPNVMQSTDFFSLVEEPLYSILGRVIPFFSRLKNIRRHVRALKLSQRAVSLALRGVNVDAAIVLEDGVSGPAAFIAEMRKLKLPIFILPYEISQKKDLENSIRNKIKFNDIHNIPRGIIGYVFSKIAGHWICPFEGANSLYFNSSYILARIIAGMDIPNPWITHGGKADILIVESLSADRIYAEDGVALPKRQLLGTPYLEVLAKSLECDQQSKDAFTHGNLLSSDEIRILVSLPPNYGTIDNGKVTYIEYATSLINKLSVAYINKKVCINLFLHPAMLEKDINDFQKIVSSFEGCHVNISIDWIIPEMVKHDLVISFFSSTIRWALAAGKPVINLDPYHWNLNLFDSDPGFIKVNSLDHFSRVLNTLDIEQKLSELVNSRTGWGEIREGYSKEIIQSMKKMTYGEWRRI